MLEAAALALTLLAASPTPSPTPSPPPPAEPQRPEPLEREQARRVPGAWGDPLRAALNEPAVHRSFLGFSGEIILRGMAPEDTRLTVDGHDVPLLYHFGALKSLINPEMLDSVTVRPEPDSIYAPALGGVVDARTRSVVPRRVGWRVQTELLDAGLFLEVPVGRGYVSAAARRTWPDLVLRSLDLGAPLPRYFDYQLKADFPVGTSDAISFFAFGADDGVVNASELTDIDPQLLRTVFHQAQARWRHVLSGGHELRVSGAIALERGLAAGTASPTPRHRSELRADYQGPLSSRLELSAGTGLTLYSQSADQTLLISKRLPSVPEEQQLTPSVAPERWTDLGAWARASWRLSDVARVEPGVRVDRFGAVGKSAASPRLETFFIASEATQLRVGGSITHQSPRVGLLGAFVTDLGALGLDAAPERAATVWLGGRQRLGDIAQLRSTLWLRRMQSLVELYPLDTVDRETLVLYRGPGRAAGLDVSVELNPLPRLFGWLTWSVSRSERREDGRWFPSGYDQTHRLGLALSYRVLSTVRIGARARFATGTPFTPYIGSVYDADSGNYYGILDERNSARTGEFFQLDFRVDKAFPGRKAQVVLYADVMNVTNHSNRELPVYNFDYTRQYFIPGVPVFPMIGVEIFH